jgi:hypothetical protein
VPVFTFAGFVFAPHDLGRAVWRWFQSLSDVGLVQVARFLGIVDSEDLEEDVELALCEALEDWYLRRALGMVSPA